MFSSNTDSLGYQSFKRASYALVSGLHLGDTIKGLLLVLVQFLIPMFRHTSWVCTPIISNPINIYIYIYIYIICEAQILLNIRSKDFEDHFNDIL